MNLPEAPADVTPLSYRGDDWALARLELPLRFFNFFTLGLYSLWGKVRLRRYIWDHTYVGDAPLRWLGGPADQGRAQEWPSRLTAILVLIRGFTAYYSVTWWLTWGMAGAATRSLSGANWLWVVALTPIFQMAGNRFEMHHSELHGIRFGQDGTVAGYAKCYAQGAAWTLLTLGWGYAWWSVATRRYLIDHSRYGDVSCRYLGSVQALRPIYVWGTLACVCTLGAYYPWHLARLRNYHANHTHLGPLRLRSRQEGYTLSNLVALNLLIFWCTLGLGAGLARSRAMRYQMQHLDLVGDAQALVVRPGADAQVDGLADTLSDVTNTLFDA